MVGPGPGQLVERVDFYQSHARRVVHAAHDRGVRRGRKRVTIAASRSFVGGTVVASISAGCVSASCCLTRPDRRSPSKSSSSGSSSYPRCNEGPIARTMTLCGLSR